MARYTGDYLVDGNSETGRGCGVGLFNVPIEETCKPTPWCKENCYGKKGYHIRNRKTIAIGAERRLKLSKSDEFIEFITKEVLRRKFPWIRLHAIGDFYTKEYIQKWMEIAKNCPQTIFRTTTKRRDFKDVILELHNLPNFHIRESLDPSRTKPTMRLPIAAVNTIDIVKDKRRNFFKCKQNCRLCKHTCWCYKNRNYCFPII